ncbi:hypothetical protein BDZ88DRAFT_263155 [Geranomyces variabilis]|nr:hypothetical protein BDZ88DRAFT_263155 [Geranomyces variabilis]KAJ3143631.1 hypothetical protein HDU90_000394 [Geranomyces variabilis]
MSLRRSRKITKIPAPQDATSASASSTSSAKPSALNSVVSSLMRAAIGGVPSTVSDDELQRYIADKVLEDAAKSNARYSARNTATKWQSPSLTAQPKNALKPNKRFLAAVIRSTDSHNDALLKKEAVEAELRLTALEKSDARSEEDGESSNRADSDLDRRAQHREQRSHRSSSRSRSPPTIVSRSRRSEAPHVSDRHHKTRRRRREDSSSRSRSPPQSKRRHLQSQDENPRRRSRLPSESDSDDDGSEDDKHRRLTHDSRSDRRRSGSHPDDLQASTPAPPLPPSKRGRGAIGSSRMDRYFEKGYDPSLDIDNYGDQLDAYVDRIEELRASKAKASSTKTKAEKRQLKRERKDRERTKRKNAKRKERDRKWRSGSSKKRKTDDMGEHDKPDGDPPTKELTAGPRLPATCPW